MLILHVLSLFGIKNCYVRHAACIIRGTQIAHSDCFEGTVIFRTLDSCLLRNDILRVINISSQSHFCAGLKTRI
ncbi:MAG: hypothetical protein ACYCT7_08050 [bacterium]